MKVALCLIAVVALTNAESWGIFGKILHLNQCPRFHIDTISDHLREVPCMHLSTSNNISVRPVCIRRCISILKQIEMHGIGVVVLIRPKHMSDKHCWYVSDDTDRGSVLIHDNYSARYIRLKTMSLRIMGKRVIIENAFTGIIHVIVF